MVSGVPCSESIPSNVFKFSMVKLSTPDSVTLVRSGLSCGSSSTPETADGSFFAVIVELDMMVEGIAVWISLMEVGV